MSRLLSVHAKKEAPDEHCGVRAPRPGSSHMGFVKKRVLKRGGQVNTAFNPRFFVLSEGMLEYYDDEKTYLVEKVGGLRGSIPTRNIKVKSGADKSNDGYLFTIEDTSSGKLIECACEDAQDRDMWVQKIEASYHRATVHNENVTIAVFIKPEEGHDIGRIHYFHAENEQQCLTWTKALQDAIANAVKRQRHASIPAFRRMVIKLRSIYNSDLMQYFVVGMIISNFVANVVEFELMSADPAVIQRFTDLDLTFTIIFSVEFITNMISHVDMLPFPFMSDSWNILDFVICSVSLFSVSGIKEETKNTGVQDNGIKTLRIMRVLRVFRVFRLFRRVSHLRSIMNVNLTKSIFLFICVS
jgi:hypothetical protein